MQVILTGIFLATFLASCQSINFLPTEYSSYTPFQFDLDRTSFALKLDLCNVTLYTGCVVTSVLNLPFTRWNVADGTFALFRVSGSTNDCPTIACQNDPNAALNPNQCSFVYDPSLGSSLFVYGNAGKSAGFQATFNAKISCPAKPFIPKPEKREPSGLTACPTTVLPTKRSIVLVVPGNVSTSPRTEDAVQYSVSVCSSKTPYASIVFSSQSTDQVSAFATYFCPGDTCNTNISPVGWYDQSGTASNFVQISQLQTQTLTFIIYGWGRYEGTNSFVFNIAISDIQ
jgi:hypothetical protein